MPKCKICKSAYEKKYFNQQWCSPECAVKLANIRLEKKDRSETRERKEKLKTRTQKINDAKKVFQKWIRNRDEGFDCISCGAKYGNYTVHAGHYRKAEIYRGVIFDTRNVHAQCSKCNTYLGGNEANYRTGLVKKIGESEVLELERLAEETKRYKWSDEELNEIKRKYRI